MDKIQQEPKIDHSHHTFQLEAENDRSMNLLYQKFKEKQMKPKQEKLPEQQINDNEANDFNSLFQGDSEEVP